MNERLRLMLAAAYTTAELPDETLAYQLNNLVEGVAYDLFKANTDEATAELERLIIEAKTKYGVSITALIKRRVEWVESYNKLFGERK